MSISVDVDVLAPYLSDDLEGARVALVDAAHDSVSETLTASVRRADPGVFEIVEPQTFMFSRLRDAIVVGLGVYVGDWRGRLEIDPWPIRSGDVVHVYLPGIWSE